MNLNRENKVNKVDNLAALLTETNSGLNSRPASCYPFFVLRNSTGTTHSNVTIKAIKKSSLMALMYPSRSIRFNISISATSWAVSGSRNEGSAGIRLLYS